MRGTRSITLHSCARRSRRLKVANSRFTEAAESSRLRRDLVFTRVLT
jgi:hypothetical protein